MNEQLAFHPPAFTNAIAGLPLSSIESFAIVALFVVWALYSMIVAYHWIAYGGFTHRGIPSLAVHVLVSASLFLFAMSGIS